MAFVSSSVPFLPTKESNNHIGKNCYKKTRHINSTRPSTIAVRTCITSISRPFGVSSTPLTLPKPQTSGTIHTASQFLYIRENAEKVVLLFHANHCRMCKAVIPKFERLAANTNIDTNISFGTVPVDKARELASRLGVHTIPTAIVVENGAEIHRFTCGMNGFNRLKEIVQDMV